MMCENHPRGKKHIGIGIEPFLLPPPEHYHPPQHPAQPTWQLTTTAFHDGNAVHHLRFQQTATSSIEGETEDAESWGRRAHAGGVISSSSTIAVLMTVAAMVFSTRTMMIPLKIVAAAVEVKGTN
jgi:hypothetical protein